MKLRARNSLNTVFYFDLLDIQGRDLDEDYFYIKQTGFRLLVDTIERSTGLADKNGTDIFERDILGGRLCTVEWNADQAKFCIRDIKTAMTHWISSGIATSSEVVGNTRDNPELLGK